MPLFFSPPACQELRIPAAPEGWLAVISRQKQRKTAGRSQNARDACRMDAPGGGLPMRSLWSDTDAERMVERYAQQGVARDLALRVYTSRLLGGDPKLVL